MFEHSRYRAFDTRLDPGDMLLLYSDGITEAENPRGQPFDDAGLERVLVSATSDARGTAASILDAVASHAQSERYADDLTVLVLKRETASPAGSTPVSRFGV